MSVAPDVESGGGGLRAKAEEGAEKAKEKGLEKLGEMEGAEGITDALGGSDTFILKKLLIVIPCLYGAWYGAAAALSFGFGISGESFLITGFEPFDHIQFSPVFEGDEFRPLVHFLGMVLTMCLAGPWLIYFACRPEKRATEISTAINSLHFFLATTVTQETPENWIWWATFMASGFFMGRMAEFMIAKLPVRRKRRRKDDSQQMPTPYNKTG